MKREQLDFQWLGDALVARLRGEVDLSNAHFVKEQLLQEVPNTASALVLDLSGTTHLDSSGVRLIFELADRLGSRRQRLELVVPDDARIRRVLLLTEVDQVVPISTSVEQVVGD
jgi:anti-anti-sigma factor